MKCCGKSSVASQAEVSNKHRAWECGESRLQETPSAEASEGAEVIQSASKCGKLPLAQGSPWCWWPWGRSPAQPSCADVMWSTRSGCTLDVFCCLVCLKYSLHPCQGSWTWPCWLTETPQGLMDGHGKGTWNILAAAHMYHRDLAMRFAGTFPKKSACTAVCSNSSWANSPKLSFDRAPCH